MEVLQSYCRWSPSLILSSGQIDPNKYQEIYKLIRENAPDLVDSAFSIIPNQGVINLLGYLFCNIKNYPEAAKAFEASLKLNPDQEKIKQDLKIVKDIIIKKK